MWNTARSVRRSRELWRAQEFFGEKAIVAVQGELTGNIALRLSVSEKNKIDWHRHKWVCLNRIS